VVKAAVSGLLSLVVGLQHKLAQGMACDPVLAPQEDGPDGQGDQEVDEDEPKASGGRAA